MRTSALRRCAPPFPFIRWRGNVVGLAAPFAHGVPGSRAVTLATPLAEGLGTGSGPGVFAHPRPRPLRVATAPAIPPGRGPSTASRRRRTCSPTGWPSGCSASPSKTGTSPSQVAVAFPQGPAGWERPPQRRGGWGCPAPSSPVPIEVGQDGGSLPATSGERGSVSTLRWLWRNLSRPSGLHDRGVASRTAISCPATPKVNRTRTDRHRDAPSGSGRTPSERLNMGARLPMPRLVKKPSTCDLSFAQIVRSVNREESNDGTH